MREIRRYAITGGLILLGGCVPAGRAPEVAADAPAEVGAPQITLARAPCYGTCPVYELRVYTDGTVEYDGKAHVAQTGGARASVDPEAVQALVAEFQRAGFGDFAERYTFGETACGWYASDLPVLTLTLRGEGVTKRVELDPGCADAPPAVLRLGRAVDALAGSDRWVGLRE